MQITSSTRRKTLIAKNFYFGLIYIYTDLMINWFQLRNCYASFKVLLNFSIYENYCLLHQLLARILFSIFSCLTHFFFRFKCFPHVYDLPLKPDSVLFVVLLCFTTRTAIVYIFFFVYVFWQFANYFGWRLCTVFKNWYKIFFLGRKSTLQKSKVSAQI